MQANDLARLSPPPRRIPLTVGLVCRLPRLETPLRVLILGVLISWPFTANADWRSFLFMNGVMSAPGRVVGVERRDWQEGNRDVFKVNYEFARGGKIERGSSHFVGASRQIGDGVTIEWPASFPQITRIKEGRTAPLPSTVLLVLLFPLFGLLMMRVAWRGATNMVAGMSMGVAARKAGDSGLVDPITQKPWVALGFLPRGLEVGFDGAWEVSSFSSLLKPGATLLLAGAAVYLLITGFLQ